MKLYKMPLFLMIVFFSSIFNPNYGECACGCSITGPGQFAVVNPMANPVERVEFTLLSPYTFGSMTPPSNWTYTLSNGDTKATFSTTVNSARINANDCLTFTLNVNNYSGDITLVLDKVEAFDKFGTKTSLDTNFAKLLVNIIADPSTVANGGTITVSMTVQNNGSVTATVTPSTLTLSNPALATRTSGPTPATLSIAAGASGVFTWTYTAAASPATGALTFSGSARDAGNCLYSQWATSNTVLIGAFTASLSATPILIVSGNTATVTMIVTNNTGVTLTNVTPSALTVGGTATKVLASGPTPATISSLANATSGSFQWTYTITGSAGQTYNFTGNATSGSYTTNTATSDTGQVSSCSATPGSVVNNGDGTYTVTWTLCNNSGSSVTRIDFSIPWPWLISSVSTALGTVATQQNPTSSANGSIVINPASLANGNCGTVSVIFSSIPDGGTYSFPVNMQGGGCSPINTLVSAPYKESKVILSVSPSGKASSFAITATLCSTSSLSGNISFISTGGTLSSASQSVSTTACSPCTDCPGVIWTQSGTTEPVILTCNSYDAVSSTVTGQFLTTTDSVSVELLCRIKSLRWREVVR